MFPQPSTVAPRYIPKNTTDKKVQDLKPFLSKSVHALLNESLQTVFPSKLAFYSISLQLWGAEENE